MASNSKFLTIPLELRHHIYSYLLINNTVVNIATQAVSTPLQSGIVRSCWQISLEILDFYYANNTFLLALYPPIEATPRLRWNLSRVRHLQVEFGDLVFRPQDEAFFLHKFTHWRNDWFLETLREAKRGHHGQFLKTLVAIDRCGNSIVSGDISPTAQICKDQTWREEKRREALAAVLRPLCDSIEKITIESRAMSEERDQRGRLTKTWSVVLSAAEVKPLM